MSEEQVVKRRGRPKKIEAPIKENISPRVVNSAMETISEFSSEGEILSAKLVDKILQVAGPPVYFERTPKKTTETTPPPVESAPLSNFITVGVPEFKSLAERAYIRFIQGSDIFDAYIEAGSIFMQSFVKMHGKDLVQLYKTLFSISKISTFASKDLKKGDIVFDYSPSLVMEAFLVVDYFPEENILQFYSKENKTTNKWYCFGKIPN